MSALPPIADTSSCPDDVGFVPGAEITESLDRLMMRGLPSKVLEARGGRNSHYTAPLLVNLAERPSSRERPSARVIVDW